MDNKIKGLHSNSKGYYRWQPPMKDGKRDSPISLGTKNYVEAVIACDQVRRDWKLGRVRFEGSFAEALKEYLEEKGNEVKIGERSPNTHYRSQRQLPIFDKELALLKSGRSPSDDDSERKYHSRKLKDISKEDIKEWQQWKKNEDLSDGSINTYSKILAAFFNWCVNEKKLSESPFAKIKIPKARRTGKGSIQFYNFDERNLLLKAPPTEELSFVLHLGFFAGLRYEEMNAMEADWIKGDILEVKATEHFMPKDGEARKIPINSQLKAFLQDLGKRPKFMFAPRKETWNPTPKNRYRFDCTKSYKTYVTKTCGLKFISVHSLRRSFATHLASKGIPIAKIAEWLGDDIRITEKHYIGQMPTEHLTDCL